MRIILICVIVFTNCYYLNAQYKIGASNNYPPFNYIDDNGELVGFNIDMVKAINKLYNNQIEISGTNWQTVNKMLEEDLIDGIAGAHYPGYPDNKHLYTRSVINTSHCFFYNSNFHNKITIEMLRTMKEPVVALWNNEVLVRYMLSINPSTKFVYANNYNSLIQLLDDDNTTCAIAQRIGGKYDVIQHEKEYIKTTNHRILERNMGFMLSANSVELAAMINNATEVLLSNGEYQRIYDKWLAAYDKESNQLSDYWRYIIFLSAIVITIILLLIVINRILQSRVQKKTKDLQHQLHLNSEMLEELSRQKNKAEQSDRMKSAFLANMSHEIRTPMNGILGFAELLKTQEFSEEEDLQFISIIQQSGDRMLSTINNIIDISKIESGNEEAQIRRVDISQIICDLGDFFMAETKEKGIELIIEADTNEATSNFYSDKYKLTSILTNLIKNAIKFTHEGHVKIVYALSGDNLKITVSDTGIGIAPEKQKEIFDYFVQANHSHSSGYEGSGLGLSITRGYVKLLNGEISVSSTPLKGTSFTFVLPNLKTENTKEELTVKENTAEQLEDNSNNNLNIIIAEDDEISYNFLCHILSDVSNSLKRAKNGTEVAQLVQDNPDTDVVLMDIKLPEINGFEATKRIRTFNKDVYIIAQTAYAQEKYKQEAIAAGCNDFIVKPIDKNQLKKILSNLKQLV
ncbi:ATP-binding protein [Draconibacterium halophilum]|uniref:histidine kinase n=1 Tax=Draconibacterium halophilum TaxID=2706887 RepID=A0A6C0RF58_9BACT|nr:ATP-binding protein [Draconibacterium halophilum]QIA08173.1 transporter substrate-binding domain-containing protein [Draconibacterium halophilum]